MRVGLKELEDALRAHKRQELPALPGRTNHLKTGVLVPLLLSDGLVAVLTLRASTLRKHAGEVAFPGGKPDPEDASLEATALREANEELGITEAQVLGRLSSIPLYTSDYRLEPFVAVIPQMRFRPNEEVERVLLMPIYETLRQPSLSGLPYKLGEHEGISPLFFPEGCAMFGATAYAFLELLQVCAPLFGLPMPPLVPGELAWEDLLAGK